MDEVEFEAIEQQKENIEPLAEGRSASALKKIFSVPHSELRKQQIEERVKIEKDLEQIEELDDPIQPYLDYIRWIETNYPSGASVESGLVQVLERCTSQFRDLDFYKNDSRYLRVWLTYAKYSENPRDIFVYLARKEIGTSLALYYEEYANYLEHQDRILQAQKVYEEGINVKARPFARLSRRYDEFQRRTVNRTIPPGEPQSPVFPIRSALSLKSGGSLSTTHEGPRTQKRKLEIFNDDHEEGDRPRTGGWETLGTSGFRNKENRLEATPWAGEVLKQEHRKKERFNKISVFQDGDSDMSGQVFKIIEQPGKKPEKVDMNFDLLYRGGEEFCIQEVLVQLRSHSKGKYQPQQEPTSELAQSQVIKSDTAQQENIELIPEPVTERQDATIYLKKTNVERPPSPTVTLFTKAAKDEIYSMFNQKPAENALLHREDERELVYDDMTEQLTRPNLNDLTEKVSDLEIQRQLRMSEASNVTHQKTLSEQDIKNSQIGRAQEEKKGPVVDPMDEGLKEMLLQEIKPPLKSYPGFHEFNRQLRLGQSLKKSLNTKSSRSTFLNLNGNTYNLNKFLGEGGFACVYLAESMTGEHRAIKLQTPASSWEFYILKQIQQRLNDQDVLRSIISSEGVYVFEDESYLLLDYEKQGTILDIVNSYKSSGRSVDESLAIFLTVEILKIIEALHGAGILHGDLKPDNCMLRLDPGDVGKYSSNGDNGWYKKGIKMIDFGRSVDMTLFPSNTEFRCNWKTDNQDCPEMRSKESWTYQADYYGIAAILHTMLYGTFIETTVQNGKHKIAAPFKRYWNQELWVPLFDLLINSKQHGVLPITQKLREHRIRLQSWLDLNGGSLGSIIRDIETGLH